MINMNKRKWLSLLLLESNKAERYPVNYIKHKWKLIIWSSAPMFFKLKYVFCFLLIWIQHCYDVFSFIIFPYPNKPGGTPFSISSDRLKDVLMITQWPLALPTPYPLSPWNCCSFSVVVIGCKNFVTFLLRLLSSSLPFQAILFIWRQPQWDWKATKLI